jgi:Family of unknown function (DUF5681)
MVWKPGQSGNPAGKKPGTLKEKPYRDALRMEIAAAEDLKGLRSIARAHLEKARSGDMAAIKELADRLDGRPAQAVVGDDEANPISVVSRVSHGLAMISAAQPAFVRLDVHENCWWRVGSSRGGAARAACRNNHYYGPADLRVHAAPARLRLRSLCSRIASP